MRRGMSKLTAAFLITFSLWTGAWFGGMCEAYDIFSLGSRDAGWWANVFLAISAVAGAALVAVGAWQISAARSERKGWETLKAL